MRWNSVVEKVSKGIGGNQEEILLLQLSREKFGGYKTEVKVKIETRERPAPRNHVKEEQPLRARRDFPVPWSPGFR